MDVILEVVLFNDVVNQEEGKFIILMDIVFDEEDYLIKFLDLMVLKEGFKKLKGCECYIIFMCYFKNKI